STDPATVMTVAGILVADPKNETIRVIYEKALEYFAELKQLAARLFRSAVQESRAGDTPSQVDLLGAKHAPAVGAFEAVDFLDTRSHEHELDLKKDVAAAVAYKIQELAALRRAQQLRDELCKLHDDILRDYAESLTGPPDQQYASRVRYNQEVALQDKERAELKDVESEISA